MDLYSIASFILTLAIFVAYINHRFIKMQTTIAIMMASMLISLVLIIFTHVGLYSFPQTTIQLITHIDFSKLLINGMLSFLLFAGALTIDIKTLRSQRWEIFILSTFSTIASALLIALGSYFFLPLIGLPLEFIYCLLFGALISPTDPIAVLATFKQIKAPKILESTVAGESLFNDGVGIVMFLALYHLAFSHQAVTFMSVTILFTQQAIGGVIYGLIIGVIGSWLMKFTDDHKLEILLTIAIATGGYTFAQSLDISGPLAMVVAGIVVGNYGRNHTMSKAACTMLDEFWELIDEILNSVLFLLVGFALLNIIKGQSHWLASLLAIPLVLFVRYVTVAIPLSVFKIKKTYCPHMITILVWGGLRGGLAMALALTLPLGDSRELLLVMTYSVVAFAVIIQGLTIKPLIQLTKS
ncbi:MAG: sodium:proton antiporter [Gammaproteobacteria bacterium]|nr:sodium:proton antiporter [Gammaproteobacteria bacterium]